LKARHNFALNQTKKISSTINTLTSKKTPRNASAHVRSLQACPTVKIPINQSAATLRGSFKNPYVAPVTQEKAEEEKSISLLYI